MTLFQKSIQLIKISSRICNDDLYDDYICFFYQKCFTYLLIQAKLRQIQSHMDELKQIITYKLKLIQQYRSHTAHSVQDRLQLTQLLLKQKRKQNSRDVIQSRLLQNLAGRKIQAPYRIQEFYSQSLQLMQMYSPDFQHIKHQIKIQSKSKSESEPDTVDSIVSLYINFFMRQDCERRAQELKHIYSKNLCQRGVIIPTVMHWFAQWLRKIYREFIKKTLAELNDKQNSHSNLVDQRRINRNKKFMQQISAQRASLSIISSQIQSHKLHGQRLQSNKSLILVGMQSSSSTSPSKQQQQQPTSQLLNPPAYIKSIQRMKSQPCAQQSLINNSTQNNNNNNNIPSSQYGANSIVLKQKQKQKTPAIYLNKDIFFSAFFEEINSYYKFNSTAMSGELDQNYPRNFRKVDRRQQINKNLTILIKSLTRNQPNIIKQQIQKYYDSYTNKFGNSHPNLPQDYAVYNNEIDANTDKITQRLKMRKKQKQRLKQKQKRRAESVNMKSNTQQQQTTRISQSIQGYRNPHARHSQSYKHQGRIQAQKRKVQLQLPEIKSKHVIGRSVQKIILVNHEASNRYSKSKILPQRVSIQLYKQLRQINGLFKNSSRKMSSRLNRSRDQALIIDRSILHQADIRWGKQISSSSPRANEIGELLDGHFQAEADGIFRLPKLCR